MKTQSDLAEQTRVDLAPAPVNDAQRLAELLSFHLLEGFERVALAHRAVKEQTTPAFLDDRICKLALDLGFTELHTGRREAGDQVATDGRGHIVGVRISRAGVDWLARARTVLDYWG